MRKADSAKQPSVIAMRKPYPLLLVLTFVLACMVSYVFLENPFGMFRNEAINPEELKEFMGISSDASKEDVRYILGAPGQIFGRERSSSEECLVEGESPWWCDMYWGVFPDELPEGRTILDYDMWVYSTESTKLTINFNDANVVEEVICKRSRLDATAVGQCQSILGIHFGASEDFVKKTLGVPSSQRTELGIRTLVFVGGRLWFQLKQRKVFAIGVDFGDLNDQNSVGNHVDLMIPVKEDR